jgi:tripartite-type tricarboxylate transporter receptor subunit TctC
LVVVAHPSLPAKNTNELVALLKANPGKYSYASPGVGTVHHLAMELFKKQGNFDFVHVPYKGAAPIIRRPCKTPETRMNAADLG